MSLVAARRQIEAVDVGREVDADNLLARVRERIRNVAGTPSPSTDPTGTGTSVRFGRAVVRVFNLMADHLRDQASSIDLLERWVKAETARNARKQQEQAQALVTLAERLDQVVTRLNALDERDAGQAGGSVRTEPEHRMVEDLIRRVDMLSVRVTALEGRHIEFETHLPAKHGTDTLERCVRDAMRAELGTFLSRLAEEYRR